MKAIVNNVEIEFNVISRDLDSITIEINNKSYKFNEKDLSFNISDFDQDQSQVFDGDIEAYAYILPKAKRSGALGAKEGSLISPMPGKIFKVLLKEGDSVKVGDTILIMEAMKMEHAIKANKDGVISKILFNEGEQVSGNSALCELE